MIMFFVYMLKSKNHNWYYVGSTKDVNKRLKEHNRGQVRSTKFRLPYDVIYSEKFDTALEARQQEKKIKLNRQLKESIIRSHGPIV